MRVLITGGNGYVGRQLTRLLHDDHDVRVVDLLRTGSSRFRPEEERGFELVVADIREHGVMQRQVDEFRPDVVVHLAAIHYIPECEARPDEAVSINTLGTVEVLRALPPDARVVLASTAAVYAPEQRAHSETGSPIGPLDVYGWTKLHAEQFVRYYAAERRLDARIVRLFNVVGPGETNPHLLPAVFAQVLQGARRLRLGNVEPQRDYVHVEDVARGFAAVALGGRVTREGEVDVVNLGSGRGWSVRDVVTELGEAIGEPLEIEVDPDRVRAVDRPFLLADRSRIEDHYGWSPARTLRDALEDLLRDPDVPAELLERS